MRSATLAGERSEKEQFHTTRALDHAHNHGLPPSSSAAAAAAEGEAPKSHGAHATIGPAPRRAATRRPTSAVAAAAAHLVGGGAEVVEGREAA